MQLPTSLQLVYALYASSFQLPSLALLSIVNVRVKVPAKYLPVYGGITFLPYSLRPIFAYISSLLLHYLDDGDVQRHDKLLPPALALASFTYVGTIFIPVDGIVPCFVWGFVRGVATAWIDFLLGLCIIEMSQRKTSSQKKEQDSTISGNTTSINGTTGMNMNMATAPFPCTASQSFTYDELVSLFTAQSRTASNLGSFVSSVVTFGFFTWKDHLGPAQVATLLIATAVLFLVAVGVAVRYQAGVACDCNSSDFFSNGESNRHGYNAVQNTDDNELVETESESVDASQHHVGGTTPDCFESDPLRFSLDNHSNRSSNSSSCVSNDDATSPTSSIFQSRRFTETCSLVLFQALLAVSALESPIVAGSSRLVWIVLVMILAILLLGTLCASYFIVSQQQSSTTTTRPSSPVPKKNNTNDDNTRSRIPYKRLSLYLLLRHAMPITSYVMYSYMYGVFEREPAFLQFMSILQSAAGTIATHCYQKFVAPSCHSGWSLIRLIAGLDVTTGLAALLEVIVIRTVQSKERIDDDDGNVVVDIDMKLKLLVLSVGIFIYFLAEMNYMPSVILSTSNVVNQQNEKRDHGRGGAIELPANRDPTEHIDTMLRLDYTTSAYGRDQTPSLSELTSEVENDGIVLEPHIVRNNDAAQSDLIPTFSVGVQYASFVSCIDFGAQIGQWLSVPLIAYLGVTRENHWHNLDRLVIICSLFRIGRAAFLGLILPSSPTSFAS